MALIWNRNKSNDDIYYDDIYYDGTKAMMTYNMMTLFLSDVLSPEAVVAA